MQQDLPGWVAELTDPRRATALDELADRLVPLAEHAIDVSRRLQALLNDLNDPFKREALYGRVERLKERASEALDEITGEIAASGKERVERIWSAWDERVPAPRRAEPGEAETPGAPELRRRLQDDVLPALARQERAVAEKVGIRTASALEEATQSLLSRVEELAKWVTDLIHEVLPLAREGLELASRVSALSSRARQAGHGEIPGDLREAAAAVAADFDEATARLELEWAALGARSATVRAALRAAEETAFSQVTAEMTRCVADLAPEHVRLLGEAENRALKLLRELTAPPPP